MEKEITINKEQSLYVIPEGKGYSCLGFNIVLERIEKLSKELGIEVKNQVSGSMEAYNYYKQITHKALEKNQQTGWRSQIDLYAPFIGNEGRRVEVEYINGEKERFYIGRSTGYIPCHLIIKQSNSTGGGAVLGSLIKTFKFIQK